MHLHANLFAAGSRKIPHDPRELAPDITDRLHAGLHHPFLQFGGDQVQPLTGAEQFAIAQRAGELQDLVASEDQLADPRHQLVEEGHVDADRAVGSRFDRGFAGS